MTASFLFEKITMNQITKLSVHIPLIIIDNLPLLLSLIQIPSKIKNIQVTIFDQTQHFLSNILSISLVGIISMVIILYNCIYFYIINQKKKINNTSIPYIILKLILFYDLIIFRCFASIILFLYADLIIKCISQSLSIILLCFTLISLLCYIVTMLSHINMTYIIIHIDNKEIVTTDIQYPFDEFSRRYDLYMMTVKLVGGMEYITYYIHQNLDKITNTSSTINFLSKFFGYWFIFFIAHLYIKLFIYEILFKGKVELFLLNTKLNLLRIALISFNTYILFLMLIFLDKSLPLSITYTVIILSLSFIWTFASIIFTWHKVIIPILFNGDITIRKFAYIITNNQTIQDPIKNHIICMTINPKALFKSFKIKHFLNCIRKKCPLCIMYKEEFSNTFSYLQFFRLLLKSKMLIENDRIDYVFSSLMLLLYYRFHHKPYKYYRQHYRILYSLRNSPYQQTLLNYMMLLFASFINMNNDNNNLTLYTHITSLSLLNEDIRRILMNMKEFVKFNDDIDQYEHIIQLAAEIRELYSNAQVVLQNSDIKGDCDTNEQMTKKIKNIYHYNIMINKFIIEKIINEPLNSNEPIEPDQLVDYFSLHYHNDCFLMLNVSKKFLINEAMSSVMILKTGHSLIDYEGKEFDKIFPIKLINEANRNFITQIKQYDASNHLYKTFEFIINGNNKEYDTIDYINYKFDLLHVLCNDSLLVYGFYTHPERNIMVFELDSYHSTNEYVLWRYSETIQSLLSLPPKMIDRAKEMLFYFTFDNLFLPIKSITNRTNTNKLLKFEYVFDYTTYAELLLSLMEHCNKYYSTTYHCYTDDLANAIIKIQSKAGKQIKLTFKLLSEYSKCKAYTLKLSSDELNNQNETMRSEFGNTINKLNDIASSNQIINLSDELPSGSSVTENYSINTISNHYKQSKNAKNHLVTLYQDITDNTITTTSANKTNHYQRFNMIMNTIIFFNSAIVILCIAFLIIQIIQLNSFYTINHIYFQYKQLRIFFTHTFLSFYINVCICRVNVDQCSNALTEYSRTMKIKMGDNVFNDDYLVSTYLNKELKYKVDGLLALYNSNEDEMFYYNDNDVNRILLQSMNYSQIMVIDKKIQIDHVNLSFQEGLKKCFNSLQITINTPDYFLEHPVYLLIYENKKLNFSMLKDQNIDQEQKEIYGLIINFLNYVNTFNQGEDILLVKVRNMNSLNKFILLFILGVILGLNMILFFLCLLGFRLIHSLLFSSCMGIITLLSKKEVRNFFELRIENLIIINRLYVTNPNTLINNITNSEEIQSKKTKQFYYTKTKRMSQMALMKESFSDKTSKSDHLTALKSNSKSLGIPQDHSITEIIKPHRNISNSFFACFFIIYVLFSWLSFYDYLNVLNLASYVQMSYRFENKIYNSIGLTQIMSLLSMSHRDAAIELGYNPDKLNESIIVLRAREIQTYYDNINQLEANQPLNYPHLSTLFINSSDCQSFMSQLNDSNINLVSAETKVDFIKLHVMVCEYFKSLSLDNFSYIYNSITHLLNTLQTQLINRTYHELEIFNDCDSLFDLFTLSLFVLRPLRFYVKNILLAQRIEIKMTTFIIIIAIFLALNILMTIFIFILIKWIFFRKLNWTNESLMGLKQTMLM